MFWGLTPAIDLLNEIDYKSLSGDRGELNVLVIGGCDARHIIKTLAKYHTHDTDLKINFYVVDLLLEFTARQMLFLTIALEPPDRLGPFEKAHLWMELYGNTLVRPPFAQYLVQKSAQFIHMVTDSEYLKRRMPMIDLTYMKYKERDSLETIFRYWGEKKFDVVRFWDSRLRRALKTR
jgi:dynein assembly factor 3